MWFLCYIHCERGITLIKCMIGYVKTWYLLIVVIASSTIIITKNCGVFRYMRCLSPATNSTFYLPFLRAIGDYKWRKVVLHGENTKTTRTGNCSITSKRRYLLDTIKILLTWLNIRDSFYMCSNCIFNKDCVLVDKFNLFILFLYNFITWKMLWNQIIFF